MVAPAEEGTEVLGCRKTILWTGGVSIPPKSGLAHPEKAASRSDCCRQAKEAILWTQKLRTRGTISPARRFHVEFTISYDCLLVWLYALRAWLHLPCYPLTIFLTCECTFACYRSTNNRKKRDTVANQKSAFCSGHVPQAIPTSPRVNGHPVALTGESKTFDCKV